MEKKKKEEKQRGREEKLLKFLKKEREDLAFCTKGVFFSKSNATCPILSGAKKGLYFSLDFTSYSATKEKKLDLFGC